MSPTAQPPATDMPADTAAPNHHSLLASGAIVAESLFKGRQDVRILHKGDFYHLRITRNDKLILTK